MRLFSKLPFWKSFLALCMANDAKAYEMLKLHMKVVRVDRLSLLSS